ncbi:zinc ribbon domain-containing protein [Saccharopolyspora pogona]|uniref:zinc ribbon domain-containing protein n=1 Tax=Saccharopolyspora pogona TaxID=333966 RepID=UPI001CC22385|nr:zinc ribbon domain-containing protein [Saccharopolyspora pogona]
MLLVSDQARVVLDLPPVGLRPGDPAELLAIRAADLDEAVAATQSSWPFAQLGDYIAYKAQRVGVPVIEVDAHYTSQHCPLCGHTERANRPNRDFFSCRRCGLAGPADVVAGVNVRGRARSAWVFVNMPDPTG